MNKLVYILNQIFSITLTDDYLRYQIKFLGLKLKFPRPSVLIKMKKNPFFKYKEEGLEITQLPKATGQIRDIQLANLAILIEIDKVCKKNNIQYWIDYGNLLGAIRHKGYIPWDVDIDISMMRQDFENFVDTFEKTVENKDLYLKHICNKKGSYILKVAHKKCKYLFVDIFIYDYCQKGLNEEEKILYTDELDMMRTKFLENLEFSDGWDLYNKYRALRAEVQKDLDLNNPQQLDLMYYIEFGHQPYVRKNWVMPYDDIFPLKEIEYEGLKFPTVNKPHEHLVEVFGKNYMEYPKKIDFGHGAYAPLSQKDKSVIKELIEKSGVSE